MKSRISAPKMRVTLSLGEIELEAEDLLRLRPGTKIEFDKPQEFISELLVAGDKWADATVDLNNGKIELIIKKLETFSAND